MRKPKEINLKNEKGERTRMMALRIIDEFWMENYRQPTIREVRALGGFSSTSHVKYLLERLAKDGYLLRSEALGEISGRPVRHYVPKWVVSRLTITRTTNTEWR